MWLPVQPSQTNRTASASIYICRRQSWLTENILVSSLFSPGSNVFSFIFLSKKNIYIKLNITSSDEEHWNDRLNWLDTSLNDWFKRLSFDRIYFNYGDYKRVVDRNMRIDYLRGKYDFSYDVVC